MIGILHSDDVFFDNETLKNIASKYKISKSDLIYGNVLFSARHNLIDIKRIWKQNKIINKYSNASGPLPTPIMSAILSINSFGDNIPITKTLKKIVFKRFLIDLL